MKRLRNWYIERLPHNDSEGMLWGSTLVTSIVTIAVGFVMGVASICIGPLMIIFSTLLDIHYFTGKLFPFNKNKYIKNALKDYEKKLLKQPSLYLDDFPWKQEPLDIFIANFINIYRNNYFTLDSKGRYHCSTYRRRSVGDIYLICKYYYPDCTLEQVLTHLIEWLKMEKIYGGWCSTINKFVFHCDSDNYNPKNQVEYGDDLIFQDIVDYLEQQKK